MLQMNDCNYLIVGGFGYVGSHVAEHLVSNYPQCSVVVFDKRTSTAYAMRLVEKFKNYPERCTIVIGSSGNGELAKKIFANHSIDVVVYCVGNFATGPWNPTGCFRESLSNLTQFLEALRHYGKLKKFMLVSSEEVYGDRTSKLETTATKPSSLKGAALASCEVMLNSYIISYRIPAVIVRLSTVVFGGFMDNCLLNSSEEDNRFEQKIEPVGLLHIQDAVSGICAALEKGKAGEIYNIGGLFDCLPDFLVKFGKKEISNEEFAALPSSMSSQKAERYLLWKAKVQEIEERQLYGNQISQHSEVKQVCVHKMLIYGTEDVLKCFDKLLQDKNGNIGIVKRFCGLNRDSDIIDEINSIAPSHIIYLNIPLSCDLAADTRALLKEGVYSGLYSPFFLASLCRKYSIHFTYLTLYNSFDADYFMNYSKSSVVADNEASLEHHMAIDLFTNRLLTRFDSILICRLGFIIDLDNISGEFKFIGQSHIPDASFHISFLPDCLPIILDLSLKGHHGTVDVANPKSVTGREFFEMCTHANLPNIPSLKLLAKRTTTATGMDTSLVEKLYPNIRNGHDIINELFSKAKNCR